MANLNAVTEDEEGVVEPDQAEEVGTAEDGENKKGDRQVISDSQLEEKPIDSIEESSDDNWMDELE